MSRKITICFSFLLLFATIQKSPGQSSDIFKPYGKPLVLVFSNVHSSFNNSENNTAFELTRVYLGYEYFFSKSLSSRVNMDVGDPKVGDLQMTAYVKNAFLQYKTEKFSGRLGMISTDQYYLIEKQWGYRYLFKTFQDEYAFGPSADLGAAIEYTPSKIISFDASVLNGEGYKRVQSDSTLKYTAGVTLRPFDGMILRAYSDIMKKDYAQNTISLFAGYTYKGLKTGFEYNIQRNNRMLNNHDFSGISAWASLRFREKMSVFARYDKLSSKTLEGEANPWDFSKDGQLFMAGFDYSPVQGVRIAPAYIGWLPSDKAKNPTSTVGLYFEIKY